MSSTLTESRAKIFFSSSYFCPSSVRHLASTESRRRGSRSASNSRPPIPAWHGSQMTVLEHSEDNDQTLVSQYCQTSLKHVHNIPIQARNTHEIFVPIPIYTYTVEDFGNHMNACELLKIQRSIIERLILI